MSSATPRVTAVAATPQSAASAGRERAGGAVAEDDSGLVEMTIYPSCTCERRMPRHVVLRGCRSVTFRAVAGERTGMFGSHTRPVSWAHMATSTRLRAPSLRMRLARWALTVLVVM